MSRCERARSAAQRLRSAAERDDFTGWDPYDALTSPLLGRLAATHLLRRAAIQAFKRSPLNARSLVGIPKLAHTKGLALFTSAYARLAVTENDDACAARAVELANRLAAKALPAGEGVGWGYDFDVYTRWGFYPRGEPNAVVTSFAAHALLDAAGLTDDEDLSGVAKKSLAYARSQLLVENDGGSFFAYFRGSDVPIHNANVLTASVFARCAGRGSPDRDLARSAVQFTLDRQSDDGSWPYGEGRRLGWVDGFHTAYVLQALAPWDDGDVRAAIERGLDLYLTRLIEPDGAPRSSTASRYPLNVHAASWAITMLVSLRRFDERAQGAAGRVLDWSLANLQRPDGRFAFEKGRLFRNTVPYIRWSDSHMLLALAVYLGSPECLETP